MKQVPVHCNVLWPTRGEAINAPRGDIRLGYLPDCGHTCNLDFDPSLMEYTQEYENSLHFSPRFQEYATALAEDPSYVPEEGYTAPNVTFVDDLYTEIYTHQRADLIVCRHVLEHIEDPDAFIAQVRRAVGDQKSVVFFEVPNSLWTLRQGGIWDVIYEHCSYYSPLSLAYLFQRHGFKVLTVNEVFGGQFLTIEAVPDDGADLPQDVSAELAQLTADAHSFAAHYQAKREEWQARLAALAGAGKRGVVWGAGSKGVTFLNAMATGDEIAAVVDINPRKQGKYVPGTGQQIVPPSALVDIQPDFVIIMNANYRDEIGKMLADIGVNADILVA